MGSNPYEAPKAVEPRSTTVPQPPKTSLVLMRAQRGMMWLFVAKLGLDFTVNMVGEAFPFPIRIGYAGVSLLVHLLLAYFVFRLAGAIYGVGPGIICALLALVPCLGLLAVLVLNGNVQDYLRKAGTPVGFMGATKSQLADFEERLSQESSAASSH